MKRIGKLWLVLSCCASFLIAQEYCIQVASSRAPDKEPLIKKARDYFASFPYTRVERIGRYYVLRIGRYRDYRSARPWLRSVRRYVVDAYIRKCDWIPSRIVYTPDQNSYEETYEEPSYDNRRNERVDRHFEEKTQGGFDRYMLFDQRACPIECLGLVPSSGSTTSPPPSRESYRQGRDRKFQERSYEEPRYPERRRERVVPKDRSYEEIPKERYEKQRFRRSYDVPPPVDRYEEERLYDQRVYEEPRYPERRRERVVPKDRGYEEIPKERYEKQRFRRSYDVPPPVKKSKKRTPPEVYIEESKLKSKRKESDFWSYILKNAE